MAKYTGKDIAFSVTATPLVNLTSFEITDTMETYDATAAANTAFEFLGGLLGYTVTINLLDDTAGASYALLKPGTTAVACIAYPQGNTSTKPTRTFSAFITSRSRSVEHNGVVAVTASLQVTGLITDGTVT